ncbi:MAG: serine hydrolase [Bacteroidaceae bacterium]|nr:serine hydrolase [Bacteroidaceae bacterium]
MSRFFAFTLIFCLQLPIMAQPLKRVSPESVGMSSSLLHYADVPIQASIDAGEIPGAVLAVVRHGKMAYIQAYGNRQVYPTQEAMTTETIFDMASCSKSMGTAMCVMKLIETGQLRLLDPVSRYIPDFQDWQPKDGGEKTTIRIADLLTHTSGLLPYANATELAKKYGSPNPEGLKEYICSCRKDFEPKTGFQYSCINFITLQYIIEKITGKSLRQFARECVFGPLKMNHTDYLPCAPDVNGVWRNTDEPAWASLMPNQDWRSIVAPTTKQADGSVLRGMVHDPLARIMNGGISGNAGVFSNADDIGILCAALMNGGEWNGTRVLSPLTVETMRTVPRSVSKFGRALGWDCFSPYASNKGDLFSDQTFSHTGFTGTSIVIDPENDCAVILLVNAVHPTEGRSSMVRLRSVVSNAVAGAILDRD